MEKIPIEILLQIVVELLQDDFTIFMSTCKQYNNNVLLWKTHGQMLFKHPKCNDKRLYFQCRNLVKLLPHYNKNLLETSTFNYPFMNKMKIVCPFFLLENLKELRIRWNWITEVPSCIFGMTKLETLDISRNKLKVLSPEIGKLTNLTYLSVCHNNLSELPETLTCLTSLKMIFVNPNDGNLVPPDSMKSITFSRQ